MEKSKNQSVKPRGSSTITLSYLIAFLVMMGGITVIAWIRVNQIHNNVNQVTEQAANKLVLAMDIESQVLRLRIATDIFILSPNEENLANYQQVYAALIDQFNQANAAYVGDEQTAYIRKAQKEVGSINVVFRDLTQYLSNLRGLEKDIFGPNVKSSNGIFSKLTFYLIGIGDQDLVRLQSGVERTYLHARRQIQAYVTTGDQEVYNSANEAIDEAQNLLAEYRAALPDDSQYAIVDELTSLMEEEKQALPEVFEWRSEYSENLSALSSHQAHMSELAHNMVIEIKDELESQKVDTYSLLWQTRILIIVASAVAGGVGIIAALQFNRGIRLSVEQALTTSRLEIERELNEQLTTENLRLGAELDVTRRLQKMLLPADEELANIEWLDVAGYMDPATEVGGDYYDVLTDQGYLKIGIGDVTGHGLESGVLMLMTQSSVRALLNAEVQDPAKFLDVLNRTIHKNVQRIGTERTLTLTLLDYSPPSNGQNCGMLKVSGFHEEVILVRKDGLIQLVDTVDLGVPIGLVDEMIDMVNSVDIVMEPGDAVVLYSDGITEAENEYHELYSLERLCDVIRKHSSKSSQEIIAAVVSDLHEHVQEHPLSDDITLVVLKQR